MTLSLSHAIARVNDTCPAIAVRRSLHASGREGVVGTPCEVPQYAPRQSAPDVERKSLLIAQPELQVHDRAGGAHHAGCDLVCLGLPRQTRVGRHDRRLGERGCRANFAGHERPCAVLCLDQPLGDQHVVDGRHRIARDAQATRHPAPRWQPKARLQAPRSDRVPELAVEFSEQPPGRPLRQLNREFEYVLLR